MKHGRALFAVVVAMTLGLSGCSNSDAHAAPAPTTPAPSLSASPSVGPTVTAPVAVTPTPVPSVKPTTRPPVKPKPTATLQKQAAAGADIPKTPVTAPADGVPASGDGTFTIAPGGTGLVGGGTTLVTYRVEVENGITWGANPVWTPASFGGVVDGVLADPRGWTASAAAPITDTYSHLTNASWSFQRISGDGYSVRILLATPATTDKMCGSVGLTTEGVYSCRYGRTILINLRRWLNGAPGFPISLDGYHTMVINHEMGHLLGFKHMDCPGAGQPAPVMQQETINLGGCVANAYPFSPDGTFYSGPGAPS
jgi:hypothetical protein